MFNLCMKLVMLFCHNTNSLQVVALDARCTVEREVDTSEELHPFLHL
jgi:hypothetical protein